MSYGNLIEISVDASELAVKIDEIEQKIADLGGEDILDEDAVTRIIENSNLVGSDTLNEYVREDDIDDRVESVLSSGSYMSEYEVDDKIREALDDSTPDDDAVRAIVESVTDGRLHKLDQRIDEVDNEADNRIGSLANLIGDANKRVEALEARVGNMATTVEFLEKQVARADEAVTVLDLLRQLVRALIRN